jgi:hypothetical protein
VAIERKDKRMNRKHDQRQPQDSSPVQPQSRVAPGKSTRTAGLVPVQRKAAPAPSSMDRAPAPSSMDRAPAPSVGSADSARDWSAALGFTGSATEAPVQAKGADSGARATLAGGGSGQGLDEGVRGTMEQSFGADFSSVRVHQDGQAESLGAQAFAQGDDLHFAPGKYDASSQSGQALIGHELAHVVQQRAGRVSTGQAKGGQVHTDLSLEAEADRAGEAASRGAQVSMAGAGASASQSSGPLQLNKKPAEWIAEFETQLGSLATASGPSTPPPWSGKSPGRGSDTETYGSQTVKPEDVVASWQAFLGPGPYSNAHPRTGAPDATRLVSDDGQRSIRYGNHEKTGKSTKHHYHEETWTYDATANTTSVSNIVRRVPLQ